MLQTWSVAVDYLVDIMARANKKVLVLASVLVAIAVLNLAIASSAYSGISSKKELAAAESKEAQRPADISLVSIVAENCSDCFGISQLVSGLKSAPVSIVSEKSIDFSSAEAKQLIQKYSITKVPALIITGETEKQNVKSSLSKVGDSANGAIVFSNPPPVYVNVSTGTEVGKVSATIISADSCAQCSNVSLILPSLKASGVVLSSEKTYDYATSQGKVLLEEYNITKVPAIIFSKDLAAYPTIAQAWGRLGTIGKDGSYVMSTPIPPYVDISSGKVAGLVSATYLADKSCTECYNVSLHKSALLSFGISPSSETTYDISAPEGKALLSKYNITLVPTIVLSSEASAYPQLLSVWKQVGSIEKDGSYVFRATELMGAYKDLLSNKIIAPAKSGSAQ